MKPLIQQAAINAVQRHGGVRAAARALNINVATISMLADGKRGSASAKTLKALGLKRHVRIEIVPAKATGAQ